MIQVEYFSKGKTEDKNEDYFNHNENCFVIADGATDKSGRKYNGKTGGELVSRLIVKESLSSRLNGEELIIFLNKKVYELYENLNIISDINDPKYRFTSACIVVRIIEDKIVVTCIGDSGFRINGREIHKKNGQIDINVSEERAKYIRETGDVAGSREYIMPLLLKQFEYQNNADSPLGYGAIDGITTPLKFIKTYEYQKNNIKSIELFTDGYFDIPDGTTIKDWENSFDKLEREDPDKWKKFKSTKSKDDRTIAIIKL